MQPGYEMSFQILNIVLVRDLGMNIDGSQLQSAWEPSIPFIKPGAASLLGPQQVDNGGAFINREETQNAQSDSRKSKYLF